MYIPKGYHWLGPVGTVLLGFTINQQIFGGGFHWDVALLLQLPLDAIAVEWGAYIWQAGVAFQKYETGVDTKPTPGATVPVRRVEPPIFIDGKPIEREPVQELQQAVDLPLLSSERYVARTLINQRNGNLKVDLSETFWLKGNHFEEGQLKFRGLMRKWQYHAAIAKGNYKTATYSVTDWRKIRMFADGHTLPPPPLNWVP